MGRLTRKSLEYKDTWIADGSLSNIEGVVRGRAIDRLAEFEDLMEKYGFNIISDIEDVFLKFKHIQHTNQALKERWEKLKEIISNKQHIKDKGSNFVTLLGASGVEVFCEMLLKEMQELEKED